MQTSNLPTAELPTIVVHFDTDGQTGFYLSGDARLLIIDECAPDDRVYEWTRRCTASEIEVLIASSPVGRMNDGSLAADITKALA